jgi:hypothetical protein
LAGLRHGGHLVAVNGSTDVSSKSRPSSVQSELERGTDSAWRAQMSMHAGGRTVTSDGCRNISLHEPDRLDLPSVARIHQAVDGQVGLAGDSSSVLKVVTRVGSIVQPRIGSSSRA